MAIRAGDILFLDTNVLLTATERSREHHAGTKRMFSAANRNGIHLGISGQIIREYLAVATRPVEVNGLGVSRVDALKNIDAFSKKTMFYDETEAVSKRLRELIVTNNIHGKRIHDANIAATVLTHGLSKLVTDNRSDFAMFPEIEIVSIEELAASA